MDNKVTKRRLSDMLSYDWILIIVVALAVILLWEFIYGVAAVRLTPGQQFKFYYDVNVQGDTQMMYGLISDKKAFSYDVIEVSSESLTAEVNVLEARLSIQEGDIIFTDCTEPTEEQENKTVRLKQLVDNYYGYSYEQMLKDAKTYLLGFMKDGVAEDISASTYDLDNLDGAKIESVFRKRMKKDNRFREEKQILEGVKAEKARIERLYLEVVKFDYLLSLKDTYPELFYCYTRYEQSRDAQEKEEDYNAWDSAVQREIREGRENNIYALKVAGLTSHKTSNDKKDPSEYFKISGKDDAQGVAIMIFDFKKYQPHLQYEVISLINAIVESCSNLYDGII